MFNSKIYIQKLTAKKLSRKSLKWTYRAGAKFSVIFHYQIQKYKMGFLSNTLHSERQFNGEFSVTRYIRCLF